MNDRIKNPKEKNVLKGLAKLTVATALGLFIYGTAPEAFKVVNCNKCTLDLFNLKENGQYLSYVKEVFEMIAYPIIEAHLGLKAIQYTKEAYENFIGKLREDTPKEIR